jgi:hypothetical protein
VVFLLVVAGIGLVGAHLSDNLRAGEGASDRPAASRSVTLGSAVPGAEAPAFDPKAVRAAPPEPSSPWWLAIGGGADPVSNQVSIEQNLALATEILGEGGLLLYAGGIGHSPVHELGPSPDASLHRRLGKLFDPRDGRRARYRPTVLEPHGAATAEDAAARLRALVRRSEEPPLFVTIMAHGEPGKAPRHNRVPLWGGDALVVEDVARQLDAIASPRPLRAVITTCFSGGFGELVFRDADAKKGATDHDRCGLFAATWDTEASGCDPNPDRRVQESYSLHFFRALAGKDRDGAELADEEIDYDGDGSVSLLEAHTRVRIASMAFSVPTTTSERWLIHAAPKAGPMKRLALPEEEAVIEALGDRLDVADEAGAKRRYQQSVARREELDEDLSGTEDQTDDAYQELRIALLERWPVLDDPYHPAYAATLDRDGPAIEAFLDEAPVARGYFDAANAEVADQGELEALDVELALIERLARAYAIRAAAARLHARGGEAFETYQRLLKCERWVPPR